MDTEEAECPADRPSVTDDARAESERRYNSAALHSDLTYPAHALESHRRGAFVAGAEWAAGRAETTTEPCCAHPKCPGGSLCCCQDDPADRPSVTDNARATFDARFQHYDGYTSPARQDDLFRVFQSGMQYALASTDSDQLATVILRTELTAGVKVGHAALIALAVRSRLTGKDQT